MRHFFEGEWIPDKRNPSPLPRKKKNKVPKKPEKSNKQRRAVTHELHPKLPIS